MPYYKGQGGRPPGAKNKRTDLHAKCDKVGLDVFERMLELAIEHRGTEEEWSKLRELAVYLYAKPRDEGDIGKLTPEQVRELIKGWTHDVQSSGS